jgi:hypothetical protein
LAYVYVNAKKKLVILRTDSFHCIIAYTQLAYKANLISDDYHGQINY